jgi:tRNA G18 (ribose-2'-O)-methylase SpoU
MIFQVKIYQCQTNQIRWNTSDKLVKKKNTNLPMSNTIQFCNPILDPNKPRAVVDYMKWMNTDQIKKELAKKKNNFSILLVNIDYDNNSGNIVRTANAMGAAEVILWGRRNFDRRSSMGTEFYMNFQQIKYIEEFDEVLKDFDLIVGLDNIEGATDITTFNWQTNDNQHPKTLICLGQESTGLPHDIISKCDNLVYIPQFGSVRSLNVGTAAGIAMYDYVNKTIHKNI